MRPARLPAPRARPPRLAPGPRHDQHPPPHPGRRTVRHGARMTAGRTAPGRQGPLFPAALTSRRAATRPDTIRTPAGPHGPAGTPTPPGGPMTDVVPLGLDIFGIEKDGARGMAWLDGALCAQTDPEAFFPEKGGSTREAKKVCRSCEVRAECLEYALEHDERFGIWGGLSERERRRLKRGA